MLSYFSTCWTRNVNDIETKRSKALILAFFLILKRNDPVPEFIDPVFTKTSPKRSFSLNRKRDFWLVFAKTGSIISALAYSNILKIEAK
jgi:hypothetical protein